MVTDSFGLLLEDMAKLLKIPKLESDRNNACLIKFPNAPSIQFEIEKSGNHVLIACDLGEIPAGPYRENVFREALRYNGRPYPHACQFAYSKQTNKLVMTHLLPLQNLRAEQVIDALTPFQAIAKQWQESLARGEVPSMEGTSSSGGVKPFGMK